MENDLTLRDKFAMGMDEADKIFEDFNSKKNYKL